MAPVAASPTPIVSSLPVVPPATNPKDKKAATRKRFEAVYTVVRDELLADFRTHNMPEEVIDCYRRVRTPTTLFSPHTMFLITR
jgi:predicted alternative tryptophan synthase beta-subunit